MGNVTKSQSQNIKSPEGNSLAVFVDGNDDIMKIKDVRGNVQKLTEYIPSIPPTISYGLYAQLEDSIPVTATTEELSLIDGGVGTLTIPANVFSVGDSFQALFIGVISCVGTATLDIKIKTETGVLLADTSIVGMDVTTNKKWRLDVNFTIRNTGIAGVASIVSGGLFSYTKNAGLNFEGSNFSLVNNTTFDTTIQNKLVVTAQWNTNNGGNSIYTQVFTLNKIY
jgi:hypothetical protein